MTPWQFKCCIEVARDKVESDHDKKVWFMWHGAALQRMKKLPAIKTLFFKKKTVTGVDEAAIIGRLKEYNNRLKKGA